MDTRTWLSELLEALERCAQLVQQNTAAVNALSALLPDRTPAKVKADLEEQLRIGELVLSRVRLLQAELARADTPPSPETTGSEPPG